MKITNKRTTTHDSIGVAEIQFQGDQESSHEKKQYKKFTTILIQSLNKLTITFYPLQFSENIHKTIKYVGFGVHFWGEENSLLPQPHRIFIYFSCSKHIQTLDNTKSYTETQKSKAHRLLVRGSMSDHLPIPGAPAVQEAYGRGGGRNSAIAWSEQRMKPQKRGRRAQGHCCSCLVQWEGRGRARFRV